MADARKGRFQELVLKELHQFEKTQGATSLAFPSLSSEENAILRMCAEERGIGPVVEQEGGRLVVWKKEAASSLDSEELRKRKADVQTQFDEQREFLLWDASKGIETELHPK